MTEIRSFDPNSPAVLYAKDLVRSVQLRRQFISRKNDIDFLHVSSKNRIIYAIDSNVLWRYFYPLVGDEEGHVESAMLFHGDKSDPKFEASLRTHASTLSSTLASLVIDFGFKQHPNILLDGHNQEVLDLYDIVVGKFKDQKTKFQDIKAKFERMAASLPDNASEKDKRSFLAKNSQKIWSLLYLLKQPHLAYRRFNSLFQSQSLMSVDVGANVPAFDQLAKNGHNLLISRDDQIGAEAKEFADRLYRENYRRRKINEGSGFDVKYKQVDEPFKKDVRALTRLYEINRRLDYSTRVILITQDEKLIDLCRSIRIRGGRHSIADSYIRHPRSFLASPEILSPMSNRATSLGNDAGSNEGESNPMERGLQADWLWLDTLLTSFDKQIDTKTIDDFDLAYDPVWFNDFRQRAHDTLANDPDAHLKLIRAWDRHLRQMIEAHSVTSDLAINQVRQIFDGKLDSPSMFLSALREVVDEETEASWENFLDTTARAGYDLVGNSPSSSKLTKRVLPIAIFTQYESADTISNVLINGLELGKARSRLLAQIEALPGEDKTGYTRVLGYALLFAYADRWSIAELLARRAIETYKRRRKREGDPSHGLVSDYRISGREAYFLAAGFARINAKEPKDLDDVRSLLESARDALQRKAAAIAEGIVEPSAAALPTGIRFDSEDISIDVSDLMLRQYTPIENKLRLDAVALEAYCIKILGLIGKLQIVLQELSSDWLQERIELNTLTNFYMVLFIMERFGLKTKSSAYDDLAKEYLERYFELNGGSNGWLGRETKNFVDESTAAPSRLDRITCMYAITRYNFEGANLPPLWMLKKELAQIDFVLRSQSELIASTTYDRERYKDIMSAIQLHIDNQYAPKLAK